MSGNNDTRPSRRALIPDVIAYPEDLPITEWRPELLETIRDNQVVIVAGETGSGKSTQLPKLCLELGRGAIGRIGHTQPRRILRVPLLNASHSNWVRRWVISSVTRSASQTMSKTPRPSR